jgi:SEC-C motif-containing protein
MLISPPPRGGTLEFVKPKLCPCGRGLAYRECCAPLHAGGEPDDPERVVRSRFSAFALGEVEYLWRTLHPDHDDRARPRDEVIAELRAASRENRYMALTILDAKDTRVLFRVKVFRKGADLSFTELSEFARDEHGWRYVAGYATDVDRL